MDAVVDGHDQLAWHEKRAVVVWNVNHVRLPLAERERKNEMVTQRTGSLSLIDLFEVRRQWPKFVKIPMRSHEQVFVLLVDQGEVSHEIPDICPDAELIDLPNVDCDAHGSDAAIIMKTC